MFSLRHPLLLASFLLACLTQVPAALAQTPVSVCPSCTTAMQLKQHAETWFNADTTIPLNSYGLAVTAGPQYALQKCYQKKLKQAHEAGGIAAFPADISSCAAPVWPVIPTTRYYIRSGDLNADGKTDLFVTGRSDRFVPDFFLIQSDLSHFNVIAQPSAGQIQTAQVWPVRGIGVWREELSGDGYYDFLLEGVADVIPGAADIIVYTRKDIGTTPVKTVSTDDHFYQTLNKFQQILTQGKPWLDAFYSLQCVSHTQNSYPLPSLSTDWLFVRTPDSWYWDRYIGMYGYPPYQNVWNTGAYSCFPNGTFETAPVKSLTRTWGDYIGSGGVNCSDCTTQAQSQANAAAWLRVTTLMEAYWLYYQYFVLTGVAIGNDSLIAELNNYQAQFIVAASLFQYTINTQAADDVGPPPPVQNPPQVVPDTFSPPPGFDPDNPNQDKPGRTVGDSSRLAKNLENSGWPRPARAQAHHIVQGGCNSPACLQARQILRDYGIDIDEAVNGVWLPETQEAATASGTRALVHRINGVHSPQYQNAVLQRLQNATQGGSSGVRAALSEMRQLMTNGTKFW